MAAADRLARLVQVEPPPELDRCVRQRLLAALEPSPASLRALEARAPTRGGPAREARGQQNPGQPVALPLPERLVYTAGLVGFGAQALGAVARLIWRVGLG